MQLSRSSTKITNKEKVFQILKEKIMRQDLRAGDSLPEMAIAKELSVSRTPVREAILQLQKEGLVEIIPNRGAYVTFITLNELKNIIQLLQILEMAAAELAIDQLDSNILLQIESELDSFSNSRNEIDYEEASRVGIKLHELIFTSCGNEKLYKITLNMRDQLSALNRIAVKKPGRSIASVNEHLALLRSLKNKDISKAKEATKIHLENIYKTLTHIIS